MATRRIKDITNTATTFASDDFIALDGATQGTRKMDKDDLIAEISAGVSGDYLEEANNLSDVASLDTSKLNMEIPDVGTAPNEVPLNGMLGDMAYQSSESVSVDTLEVTDKVTGTLDVEQSTGTLTTPSSVTTLRVNNSGSASNNAAVAVTSGASGSSFVLLGDNDNDDIGYIKYSNQYNQLQFATAATDRVTIDASGNVKLDGDETELQFNSDTGIGNNVRARIQCEGKTGTYGYGGDLVFKTTADNNTSAERVRIDSSGRVSTTEGTLTLGSAGVYSKINGTSHVIFSVDSDNNHTDREFIWTHNAADGTGAQLMTLKETGDLTVKTGNLVLTSGAIDFGSGVTLDDYETGTWSPVYTPENGSFTSITMSVNNARYVKVGKQVTLMAYILTTSLNTSGGTGYVKITGLPFANESPGFTPVSVGYASNWGINHPAGGYVLHGASEIYLTERKTGIAGPLTEMTVGNLNSTSSANYNGLMFSATYTTA